MFHDVVLHGVVLHQQSKIGEVYRSLGHEKLKPYKDEASKALEKYKVELEAYEKTLTLNFSMSY